LSPSRPEKTKTREDYLVMELPTFLQMEFISLDLPDSTFGNSA
jgi:hypothetical protein